MGGPRDKLSRMASSRSENAMMAVWSKALPLTASCLSPLFGFESHTGHVRKLPVIWVRRWFLLFLLRFPPSVG